MLRDPKYIKAIRDERCIFTGQRANDGESVVPAHLGTAGKGIKSPDDEVLPVMNRIHQEMHQKGEVSTIRKHAPDWLIREMARAFARQLYRDWLECNRTT